jgi:histidine triad (HIT) family protein
VTEQPCPFCEIAAGLAPAVIVTEWTSCMAIVPLKPVVEGHVIVFPRDHVADFAESPAVTGEVARCTAELGRQLDLEAANMITSKGEAATQSVFHLHCHLVPRAENDGLALPWYSGRRRTGRP